MRSRNIAARSSGITRVMRLACSLFAVGLACSGSHKGGTYTPPPTLPSAKDVIARLAKLREARSSFTAESVMDYWLGKDRKSVV